VSLSQDTYLCNVSNYVVTTTAMTQAGQMTNPLYNPDRVQTDSDAHSASSATDTRGAFPGGKAARTSGHSLLPFVELKKEFSSTPYAFVACMGTIFC